MHEGLKEEHCFGRTVCRFGQGKGWKRMVSHVESDEATTNQRCRYKIDKRYGKVILL